MKISRILCLPLVVGALVVGTVATIKQAENPSNADTDVSELKDEYVLGDVVQIPTHTFEHDGEKVTVNGTVILPDGTSNDLGVVVISQNGDYIVRYCALVKGKNMFYEKKFKVAKALVSFKDNVNSSVVTDRIPDYAKDYTSTRGLYITLAKGDTATLEVPLDTSLFTKAEKVVNCFITPTRLGEYDFSSLTFTLSDLYDPSIYVNVYCSTNPKNTDWEGVSYWTGNANGQTVAGYLVEGSTNGVKKGSKLAGTKAKCSFTSRMYKSKGKTDDVDPSKYPLYFSFDLSENAVYSCSEISGIKTCAFTDSNYYSNIWSGFKSNKVKLSFSASSYVGAVARFCVTDVLGVDLTQTIAKSEDSKGIISIENGMSDMPAAQTGMAYKVPSATAYEPGAGELSVKTSVYYNYNSKNPININMAGDTFTPNYPGYYTIVYETINSYNVVSKKTLWVLALNQTSELSFTFPDTIPSTCKVGEIVSCPDLTDIEGGAGNYVVNKYATKGNEIVNIDDNEFQPLSTGEWIVRYTVKDYIGNSRSVGKAISVKDNTGAAFASIGEVNDRYMSGQSYNVPEIYGYTFENGVAHLNLAKLKVTDDHGVSEYVAGGTFVPYVTNTHTGSEIKFEFYLNSVKIYECNPRVIVPYVNGVLTTKNYFLGNGYDIESVTDNGLKVVSNDLTQDWNFFNPIVPNNFELLLTNIYNVKNNYNTLKITLIDETDATKTVSLYLDATNSSAKKVTVDERIYDIDIDLETADTKNIYSFDGEKFLIGTSEFAVNHFDNGEEFNGFENLVYLQVESTTSSVGRGYYIAKINNNGFSTIAIDKIKPDYSIIGSYGGTYNNGDFYVLNRAIFADVLSPVTHGYVTVTDPNGNIAKDINGTSVDSVDPSYLYTIQFDTCGEYSVSYSFDDKNDQGSKVNRNEFNYIIIVLDNESPTITIKTSWTKVAKIGENIVLPNYEIHDNNTPDNEIYVQLSVVNPQGCEKVFYSTNENLFDKYSNSIKAEIAGVYTFKIMAIDSTGNISLRTFNCTVSA